MNKLLLLALLAGCTSKPTYTPLQQAVIKYAQHTGADSARYVPLRFSAPAPFTRKDSIAEIQYANSAHMNLLKERSESARKILDQAATLHLGQVEVQRRLAEMREASNNYVSAMNSDTKLMSIANDSVIGQELRHSWRVGEKLDSAHFVVYKNGKVQRLTPFVPSHE